MHDSPRSSTPSGSPRTPSEIRAQGNRLARESSLYLRQHGHNPIDWYPWGDEALNRARDEDKLIFLSVGYSSCHWCHVMEHEVFEHDDVAARLNEHFISIKVDREERPDLDAVYMEAVQLMTGQGGWPMTVFLTPDLKPFFGATYVPRPRFLGLLGQLVEMYPARRAELEAQGHKVSERIAATANLQVAENPPLAPSVLATTVERAKELFDETHGGFSQSQKFPTPARWRFLLREFRRSGDEELGVMITHTLEAMQGGGIRDHVGGGFHRYTVDPHWTVPHFEKMLYDNAQLAGLFIEAGVVFGREDFTTTGCDVLDFMLREMRDAGGAFHASYDADSGGEEGTYYIWDAQEITAVAGPYDGPILSDLLGITVGGNFEHTGKSVVTWRADIEAVADQYGRDPGEAAALLEKHRDDLRAVRARRTPPGRDEKVITSWNGLAITALAQAHAATGRQEYLEAAEDALDFLLDAHRPEADRLVRASTGGTAAGAAILDDHAFLIDALLETYQAGGKAERLIQARNLADETLDRFARAEGGFFQTPSEAEAPLGRRVEHFDNVIHCGGSAMLHNLLRLEAATGETAYGDTARTRLGQISGLLERAGFEMAWSCAAARLALDPFHGVVIAEDGGDLRRALGARLPVAAIICPVAAEGAGDELAEAAPALAGKTAQGAQPTAYVCERGSCRAPVTEATELLEQVFGDLWD